MNVTLKPGEKWFEQFIVPSKEANGGNTPTEYHQSAPTPPIPAEFESAMAYLRHLTQEGISQRFGASPSVAANERMNRELALIEQKGWQNYFLFIWDLVKSAEETLPSCFVHVAYEAPSCLVNYLLHITEVNPLDHNLSENLFMRQTMKKFPFIVLQIDSKNYPDFIGLMKQKYCRKIAQTALFSESHTHPYTHREYPARMEGPTFVWTIADKDLDSIMPMTELCKTGTNESFSCPIYEYSLISQHGAARQNIQTAPYCIDYITQTLAELGIFYTDKKKFLNAIPLNDADTLRSFQSFNEQDVKDVFGGWTPDQGGLKNGYSHQQLEELFDMLHNTYTSPKSLDVSRSLVHYWAAYLKLHYPKEWQRAVQKVQNRH